MADADAAAFADFLRQVMAAKNLTSDDLAKSSGIPTDMIGRYLAGDVMPGVEEAHSLAAALGAPTERIGGITGTDTEDGTAPSRY